MRMWTVPVLIFLSIGTKVLSCTYTGGYKNGEAFLCSNMTQIQYINQIIRLLYSHTIRKLSIVQIYLPILDQDVFTHNRYDNLYYLIIKQCGVTTIGNNSFYEFKQLKHLDILENNIKHFEGNFITPLLNLYELDISSNNIQQFNINCNNIQYFSLLTISNNSITSLRENTFQECTSLQFFNMSNNKINNIEKKAFIGLRSVKFNNFKEIFSNIKVLKAYTFDGLINLNILDLSNLTLNDMEPQAFFGLKSLHSINLSSNNIHNFSCDIFQENNIIQNLNLGNNVIENISICMFQHLTKLKSLDLQNNRIKKLRVGSLSALNQLQELNLSYNELNTLSEAVLHPLDSLQELDISANRFTVLDPRTLFLHLTTLNQVDLSGNSWSCQNLTLIRKYLRTKNISFKSKILNFTVANIGGIQCVDEQNNEFEGGTVEYNDENKMSNKTNEVTLKEFSQNVNNNFEKLVNENSNKIGHIYNLMLALSIIYVCYKVTCFCYKFYKQNKNKKKRSNTPPELITLNPDTESV